MVTESPVRLWLLAAGVVLSEQLASGSRDGLQLLVQGLLERGLPGADSRYAWEAWETSNIGRMTLVGSCVFLLVLLLFRCFLDLKAIRAHQEILEEGGETEKEVRGRFWELFSFRVLCWGLVLGSFFLAALPGLLIVFWGLQSASPGLFAFGLMLILLFGFPAWLYVSLGVYTGDRFLIVRGLSAKEALQVSWDLARSNRVALLVFRSVCLGAKVVAVFLGLLVCGVGVLITWPLGKALAEAALSEAVLVSEAQEPNPAHWKILLAHEEGR